MGDLPDLKTLMEDAGGYSLDAYPFIRDGLAHTVSIVHGEDSMDSLPIEDDSRHVSGQQLCLGLRDYAIERYGLLAKLVLSRWNIHETEDFGKIIFAMIDAGLMRKTDDDQLEDFIGVFEFDEEFRTPSKSPRLPLSGGGIVGDGSGSGESPTA